jgi:D-alanine-D-alanine ligase
VRGSLKGAKSLKSVKDLKVCVLMGGISTERDVSLISGQTIADAIAMAGIDCVTFDIRPDNLSILDDDSIDVFFLSLHGEFGEDGELQEILESKGLCYAGSDSKASRIAIDKIACKEAVSKAAIPVAKHVAVTESDTFESLVEKISGLDDIFVVKPVMDGSSFGIQILKDVSKAARTALDTFAEFGNCMIEQFIAGREVTVGILNGKPLPLIEIVSKNQFYDYNAKYVDDTTEYLFDTIDDEELVKKTQALAVKSFNHIGCRHWGRADFIISADGTPYFLEINTLPGFTSHSLLPMAARKAGIETPELCKQIIEAAINDARNRK